MLMMHTGTSTVIKSRVGAGVKKGVRYGNRNRDGAVRDNGDGAAGDNGDDAVAGDARGMMSRTMKTELMKWKMMAGTWMRLLVLALKWSLVRMLILSIIEISPVHKSRQHKNTNTSLIA